MYIVHLPHWNSGWNRFCLQLKKKSINTNLIKKRYLFHHYSKHMYVFLMLPSILIGVIFLQDFKVWLHSFFFNSDLQNTYNTICVMYVNQFVHLFVFGCSLSLTNLVRGKKVRVTQFGHRERACHVSTSHNFQTATLDHKYRTLNQHKNWRNYV